MNEERPRSSPRFAANTDFSYYRSIPHVKPKVYISMLAEERDVGLALARKLRDTADTIVWDAVNLEIGTPVVDQLLRIVEDVDSAVFILPSSENASDAQGLYFEAGLLAGQVGLTRTLFVSSDGAAALSRLPPILHGIDMLAMPSSDMSRLSRDVREFIRSTGRRRQAVDPFAAGPKSRNRPTRTLKKAKRVASERSAVFVSYSHVDARWLKSLQIALAPLIRHDRIRVWDDSKIRPGTKWKSEISKAISNAQVAVLLVTPNFLASEFIAENELPPLLEAAEKEGLKIIWVPVSASVYKKTRIASYQAAHNVAKPLDILPPGKRNAAWVQIAEAIADAIGPQK